MLEQLPDDIQREIETVIRSKANESRVLDVYATADEICRRHAGFALGLEAIAATVARLGSQYGCAVEFGEQHAESRETASA